MVASALTSLEADIAHAMLHFSRGVINRGTVDIQGAFAPYESLPGEHQGNE